MKTRLRMTLGMAALLAASLCTQGRTAFGQGTSAPVQDDLFAGTEKFAKGASEVNEVTMDPDTLGMVNGKDSHRAHNMVLNVVRSYEYDKPGMYRMEDVEEFRKKLNTGDWHCSIHTRELKSGEGTDICNKRRSDGLVEQAIITVEPKELTFIHTVRKAGSGSSMNLPDVGGLMSDLGPEMAMLRPTMEALRPEMEAQIRVSMAEMQAQQAQMQAEQQAQQLGMSRALSMHFPKVDPPKIDVPKIDVPKIDPPKIDTPELDKQKQESQRQMKSLPQP